VDGAKLLSDSLSSGEVPYRITVSAYLRFWYGGGHLTISPRSLVLEPTRLLRIFTSVERVVHDKSAVTVIGTRLMPPFFNTSVVVEGQSVTGVATTWPGSRRRLLKELRGAGFVPQLTKAWFSMGGNYVRRRKRGAMT
jgi:hypothetical protein